MKTLMLFTDAGDLFGFVLGYAIAFIIGVFITRWIFGIDKIIDSLKVQNEQNLIQIRILKKMLLNQGTPIEEVDEIIEKGNKKK